MNQKHLKSPLPRIEGYRIEGVLGRGATGVVYSAVQLAVDRSVAIKVLHRELVGRKAAVRRLQREARTAARLAHPGIISAIDMGEQDGLWWYAMELVEGISLGERLDERGPMTEREALRFFLPLVEALQHAFEVGVVHRDIKPSNILVDAHGKARLVDLGLAFTEDDPKITKPGGTLGTPHYISPEQARDPSAADTRSDLWSLGATMYHAVCGRPPFEGKSVAEILSGVLYQRVPDPRIFSPSLSRGFTLVLRKCLTRDAEGRYAEPAALLEDLERVVERRAPGVRAKTLDPIDNGRPPWLNKALVGSGVVAVALAAVVALVALRPWSSGSSPQEAPAAISVPWRALDQLRERYVEGGLPLADAASLLAGLAAPAGGERQRAELSNRLQLDLDRVLQGLVGTLNQDLAATLGQGDLIAASALFEDIPARVQRATGYTEVAALPGGPARRRLERLLQSSGVRLAQARETARRIARMTLSAYIESRLVPEVEAARDAYRWREARALLDSRAEWLSAAGVDQALLPEDEREVLDAGEDLLVPVVTTLFAHYRRTASDLQNYLLEQDSLLREALGSGRYDSAGELRARFGAKLVSLGIEQEQVPENYQLQRPLGARLDSLAEGLSRDEAEVLEQDATEDYRSDLLRVDDLLRVRRSAAALELWDARLAEPWRATVHGEMQDRRREAELLEGLFQGAAKGLRAAHGGRLEVTLDGITHEAIVIATRPARELADAGIELALQDLERPVRVRLRRSSGSGEGSYVLPADTLIEVAGLSNVGEDAFVRALFLFHEGRLRAAQEALPTGPIEDTVLLNDLRTRIQEALAREQDVAAGRRDDKDRRVRALRRDVENGRSTYQRMLEQGQQLLGTYGDLLTDEERSDIQGICADCESRLALPTVEDRYRTASITKRFNGAVSLTWTFEAASRGAWMLGDWAQRDGLGALRLTRERASQDEYWARERALRLPLGSPLAPEEGMDLTLKLRWAEEHDEFENDVVISIAETHLLFVDGPQGRVRRWAVTQDDPGPALEELRKHPVSRFDGFAGFPRDEAFELRVQLTPGRGRMKVWIDGKALSMPRELQRVAVPDYPELVVRSWYALELLEVRLEARLR